MKTGRPCAYANNEEGLKKFEDKTRLYLKDLQKTGKFSMKKWADCLGVTRPTLYKILKRGGAWTSLIQKGE